MALSDDLHHRKPVGLWNPQPWRPKRPRRPSPIGAPAKVEIRLPITVKELAGALGVRASILIQTIFLRLKKIVKINDRLDRETLRALGRVIRCKIIPIERDDA